MRKRNKKKTKRSKARPNQAIREITDKRDIRRPNEAKRDKTNQNETNKTRQDETGRGKMR